MHILIIHQAFAALDEAGGTRHYEISRHLVKLGHRVTIIASPVSYLTGKPVAAGSPGEGDLEPSTSLIILRAYTYPALHRDFIHRVFSFLSFMVSSFIIGMRVKQADLVWGSSPPIFQGVTAWLVARLKGVPFLFEVRDLWPAFAVAVGVLTNPLLITLSEWLERFLYHSADRVVANSPGYLEHILKYGARNAVLIPNGSDPSMFKPGEEGVEFKARHNLTGKFSILYTGAHGLSNDLGVVLDAAVELAGNSRIQFVLIGDGKEKKTLMEKASRMGLTNVTFLDPLPKTEIPNAMAAASACLAILKPLPLFSTTYPNKVFDYMAAGRPVILAIDGVIRKVVEDAGAGVFIPPGDPHALAEAALSLAKDPENVRRMGAAGIECVREQFNRAEISNKMCELMEEMTKRHG